jgi:hypothetical protein
MGVTYNVTQKNNPNGPTHEEIYSTTEAMEEEGHATNSIHSSVGMWI